MISEHAMLILILLLAVAVVLLAVAIMFISGKIDKLLTPIELRIDATGAASTKMFALYLTNGDRADGAFKPDQIKTTRTWPFPRRLGGGHFCVSPDCFELGERQDIP